MSKIKNWRVLFATLVVLGLAFGLWMVGAGQAAPLTRALFGGPPPGMVSYQGVVYENGSPFSGAGYFKFAIVDGTGTTTYWSNDGTSSGGTSQQVRCRYLCPKGCLQ